MRFQPKRFVVEVKRGTSRAAFTSADTAPGKFSEAEELLFKGPKASPKLAAAEASGSAGGRILRSLIEPPPPEVPDLPEPARRGRKPGSKNRPKAATAEATLERPTEAARDLDAAPVQAAAVDVRRDVETFPRSTVPGPAAVAPRIRLRHRSSIIKRYVLDLDPCPGQAGSLRARRAARLPR